jgi:D-glycero-D-manno-heptose 1,7-bisphosphate phosphatase
LATPGKFVLLDRDGVINQRIPNGYVTSWDQFVFLPRALDGLRLLRQCGYTCLVVSNQACVGKGLITLEQLGEITRRFVDEIERHGGHIDGVYYCPHRMEDGCGCRKPEPGLLIEAQREHGFLFEETYLIGDTHTDCLAGERVGCRVLLLKDGQADGLAGLGRRIFADLYAAAEFIATAV